MVVSLRAMPHHRCHNCKGPLLPPCTSVCATVLALAFLIPGLVPPYVHRLHFPQRSAGGNIHWVWDSSGALHTSWASAGVKCRTPRGWTMSKHTMVNVFVDQMNHRDRPLRISTSDSAELESSPKDKITNQDRQDRISRCSPSPRTRPHKLSG